MELHLLDSRTRHQTLDVVEWARHVVDEKNRRVAAQLMRHGSNLSGVVKLQALSLSWIDDTV